MAQATAIVGGTLTHEQTKATGRPRRQNQGIWGAVYLRRQRINCMSSLSQEQLEEESGSLLKQLGLSEYEAFVLVHLFQLGVGTAKDIADLNRVPRTRVYDAVESLHEKGFVDIQYTTPRKFKPASRETVLNKLDLQRENTISELSEALYQLEPVDDRPEEFGVWTITGAESVKSRLLRYIDDAEDELVYMTVDDLLTDEHLDHLEAAEERGVEIHIAGVSESVRERIQNAIPSATLFDTLWKWSEVGAGSLLITDGETVLVSVLVDREAWTDFDEVAIWGSGEHNSLVVVFRSIFAWRLRDDDAGSQSA